MNVIPHLPALRLGRSYDSLDKFEVKDHRTGEVKAVVSSVNAGIVRKDLAKIGASRAALEKFLPADRRGSMATFLNRLRYQPLDATNAAGYQALAAKVGPIEQGLAIFLSTAPSLFEPTIAGLAASGLTGDKVRIGLEKPLGTCLESSREINDAVAAIAASSARPGPTGTMS